MMPSLALFDVVKGWLARLVPEWAQFKVQGEAEYLGFILGPDTSGQWTKANSNLSRILSAL
eukprot:11451540-Karenia_brevis.AAC.1